MQLTTIPYITLWAVKFDQMVDFYRDQLQLPVEYSDENFVQFGTRGTKLYIHRLLSAPPLREHAIEIHFEVPDVDAAYTALQQRGVIFEDPPANRPWGARMAAFRDPEGFALEIVGPLNPDAPKPTY
ncbi:MAG: VOC family protein [Anaerolineales bacterium]